MPNLRQEALRQRDRTLLIVFHTHTGGTAQMADAAAGAARRAEPSLQVRLLPAPQAGPDDLIGSDGLLFATPENLAAMSGLMKDFFDRCYYPVLGKIEGRPYAALICAGSDGAQAARQIDRIATGWRLRRVADPVIVCTQAQTPEAILAPKRIGAADLTRCGDLGAMLAVGLIMGVF